MDHSIVQQILDNAGTRGSTIVFRTIREMVKDKKTFLVALVCLFPIILGIIWSYYLSTDEDIDEKYIQVVPASSDIDCHVNVPNYLPDTGEYTFNGWIYNRGDTVQQVSVNMTIGNAKGSGGGIRKTTGLMDVSPVEYEYNPEPHEFSITYTLDDFKTGETFLVIELFVNNSLSSARLIPENFDWMAFDLTQLNIEDIIGKNRAVHSQAIEIRPLDEFSYVDGPTSEIIKQSNVMPLTLTYPMVVTSDYGNSLNLTVTSPINGSEISVVLKMMPYNLIDMFSMKFNEDMDKYNFSMDLPPGFSGYDFDIYFWLGYTIDFGNGINYDRDSLFLMDVVRQEYLPVHGPEYRELVLENDTVFTGSFEYPSRFIQDTYNKLLLDLTNNALEQVDLTVHFTFYADEGGYGYSTFDYSQVFPMEPQTESSVEMTLPFILEEVFPNLSPDSDSDSMYLKFSIQVDENVSETEVVYDLAYASLFDIAGMRIVSLEDSFTPSLLAFIDIPVDISKTKDHHEFTGRIYNSGVIDKEFWVMIELQGRIYESDHFIVENQTWQEFRITIPTKNHSKEFETPIKVQVFSTRTVQEDEPEAESTFYLNVIEEGHKERRVMENFLAVYVHLFLKFIVPLTAMVYGISLIANESERRTLALYLTSPITRIELILYKYAGFLASMTVILTVPLIFIYLSFAYVLPLRLMVYYLLLLGVCVFDLFLAIAAYGAVFTAFGSIEKRPILLGISFLLVWEIFLGSMPIFLAQLTIFYHVRCAVYPFVERYVPDALDAMGLLDFQGNDFTIPMEISMITIILVVFVFLFFAIKILGSRDIN